MKIIKYLFFLTVLLSLALIIFIATQQKTYSYNTETIIPVDIETVLNDLNEKENWIHWLSMDSINTKVVKENTDQKFSLIDQTQHYKINNLNDSIIINKISKDNTIKTSWHLNKYKQNTKIVFKNNFNLSFVNKLKTFFGRSEENDLEKKHETTANKLKSFFVNHYIYHVIKVDKVIEYNFPFYYSKKFDEIDFEHPKNIQNKIEQWYITDSILNKYNYEKSPFIQLSSSKLELNDFAIVYQNIIEDSLSQKSKILDKKLKTKLLKIKLTGNTKFIPNAIKKAKQYYEEQNLEINSDYFWLQFNNDFKNFPPNLWESTIYVPYNTKINIPQSYYDYIQSNKESENPNRNREEPINHLLKQNTETKDDD